MLILLINGKDRNKNYCGLVNQEFLSGYDKFEMCIYQNWPRIRPDASSERFSFSWTSVDRTQFHKPFPYFSFTNEERTVKNQKERILFRGFLVFLLYFVYIIAGGKMKTKVKRPPVWFFTLLYIFHLNHISMVHREPS